MLTEALAVDTIRQTALLTLNTYGNDNKAGKKVLKYLRYAAEQLVCKFEMKMEYIEDYDQTLKQAKSSDELIDVTEKTKDEAWQAVAVIMEAGRDFFDTKGLMRLFEASVYIAQCWDR